MGVLRGLVEPFILPPSAPTDNQRTLAIRSAAYAVFLAVAFIAASSALQSPNKWYKSLVATGGYGSTAKSPSQPRAFSFAERVAYQRAVEDVYWRHRIWPKENPDPKPALDAVMSQTQLENKVTAYLHDSLVLDLAKVHHC